MTKYIAEILKVRKLPLKETSCESLSGISLIFLVKIILFAKVLPPGAILY